MGRSAVLSAAGGFALGTAILAAWAWWPEREAGPCVLVSGPTALPELVESSGLAVSRRHPGILWSHNDSGSAAVLFALDTAGRLRGRVRVPIRTRDWEDVSAAPCSAGDCLYIGDIGDNRAARPRVQVYRVAEPAPDDAETTVPDVLNVTYADGPHNAEAMFVAGDQLVLVTRDSRGGVYRGSIPASGGADVVLQRIGQLGLGAVTDAETFHNGASVVVRTSHEAVFYRTAALVRGEVRPYFRIGIDGLREPQGEGIAIDGTMLYLSSEGRGWNRGGWFVSLRCQLPE